MTEVSDADYEAVLDLNLKSEFLFALACVKRIRAEGAVGILGELGGRAQRPNCIVERGSFRLTAPQSAMSRTDPCPVFPL